MEAVSAFLVAWGPLIVGIGSALIALVWLIVRATPTQKDDEVMTWVQRIWDFITGLFGFGKSEGPAGEPAEPTLPGTDSPVRGGLPTSRERDDAAPRPESRDL